VADSGLSDIPLVGQALFAQTPLTYLAFVLVRSGRWLLYRAPLGLAIRATGENPSAVEAQGISVSAVRVGAVVAGSGLMAIGGAFLTMSAFNSFFFEMINGRGWICIALVVFGSWRPGKAALVRSVRGLRRLSDQAATAFGRRHSLSDIPDDALRSVDPRADSGGPSRRLSESADDPLSKGER
jgi:ABC-type uncharacterized transport system permease subunit